PCFRGEWHHLRAAARVVAGLAGIDEMRARLVRGLQELSDDAVEAAAAPPMRPNILDDRAGRAGAAGARRFPGERRQRERADRRQRRVLHSAAWTCCLSRW